MGLGDNMATPSMITIYQNSIVTPVSSISISSIPAGYTHLFLKVFGTSSGSNGTFSLSTNNSTSRLYYNRIVVNTSTAFSDRATSGATAVGVWHTKPSSVEAQFYHYRQTGDFNPKAHSVLSTAGDEGIVLVAGQDWGASAITTLNISSPGFAAGTKIFLYGVQ